MHHALLAASTGVLLLAGCGGGEVVELPSAVARELVLDLLEFPDAAELGLVDSHAEEPRYGELCPAPHDPARDGADMPAQLLGVPGGAQYTAPAEPDLWFTGALGVHVDAGAHLGGEPARLHFTVSVGGRAVLQEELLVEPGHEQRGGSSWIRIAAAGAEHEGLRVPSGARVEIAVSAADLEGRARELPASFLVGVGKPRFERFHVYAPERASPVRPSLVYVVQDTLRADRLGVAGYARPTSPRLDALAAAGVVYEHAHAASSWTWPSTASLLTGLPVELHGVRDVESCHLSTSLVTLAEVAQSAGLRSAAFSGNGIVVPGKNFDQGFERFDAVRGVFRKSDVLMPRALEWLREREGERFLLYLQLTDTHWPYRVPADLPEELALERPTDFDPGDFERASQRSRLGEASFPDPTHRAYLSQSYDASVWDGDRWLGVLLDELRALGLDDTTVVAFTSDHGEELYDHGALAHGHTLHAELVRVPLVLAGPGVPRGVRVTQPVSNVHLAGTLAGLLGLALPGEAGRVDLLGPMAQDPVHFSTAHGFWRGNGRRELSGVVNEGWVLHADEQAVVTAEGGRGVALYELAQDPAEQRDRSAEEPARVEAMHALVERRRAQARAPARFGAGAATLSTLEDIGYLGDSDE